MILRVDCWLSMAGQLLKRVNMQLARVQDAKPLSEDIECDNHACVRFDNSLN